MKPRIATLSKLFFSVSLAISLLSAGASATAQAILTVTVPFGFSIDNHALSAGLYEIRFQSGARMSLHNVDTNRTMFFTAHPDSVQPVGTRTSLFFRRQGTQNYLSQVWFAGTRMYSEPDTQHKKERELPNSKPAAESVVELTLK